MKKLLIVISIILTFTGISFAGQSEHSICSSLSLNANASSTQTEIIASRFETAGLQTCGYMYTQTGAGSTVTCQLYGGVTKTGYYPVGSSAIKWVDGSSPTTKLINFPSTSQKPEIKYWFWVFTESGGSAAVVDMLMTYTKE